MNKSDSIKNLAAALCKFQGEVQKIKKTETNPFFKSKYASLADILDVIRQPLVDNGLAFVQFPTGEHNLSTMLMHSSGEWIEDTYSMTPAKNDPQGLGSVITYQRRYALGAVLGLNIDEDDDGNKATHPQEPPAEDNRPWMSAAEKDNVIRLILNGDVQKANRLCDTFKIRKAYKEEIEDAKKSIPAWNQNTEPAHAKDGTPII